MKTINLTDTERNNCIQSGKVDKTSRKPETILKTCLKKVAAGATSRLEGIRAASKMLLAVRSPILSQPHEQKSPFSCMRQCLKTIKLDEIHLTQSLGSGGFGVVHKGIARGRQVAVKLYHKSTKNKLAQIHSFRAEQSILHFKHPYIVRLLSASAATSIEKPDQEAFLVMEYVGCRNLASVIHNSDEKPTLNQEHQYAHNMTSALVYTHNHSISHLDVKPANVLLTPEGICKLGDFGCCQHVGKYSTPPPGLTYTSHLTGTYAYRAPELLRGSFPTVKADIFSLGITLWELSTKQIPYGSENQHVVIFGVVANNLRPQLPHKTSSLYNDEFKQLYMKCWMADPTNRPSAVSVLQSISLMRNKLKHNIF